MKTREIAPATEWARKTAREIVEAHSGVSWVDRPNLMRAIAAALLDVAVRERARE